MFALERLRPQNNLSANASGRRLPRPHARHIGKERGKQRPYIASILGKACIDRPRALSAEPFGNPNDFLPYIILSSIRLFRPNLYIFPLLNCPFLSSNYLLH